MTPVLLYNLSVGIERQRTLVREPSITREQRHGVPWLGYGNFGWLDAGSYAYPRRGYEPSFEEFRAKQFLGSEHDGAVGRYLKASGFEVTS